MKFGDVSGNQEVGDPATWAGGGGGGSSIPAGVIVMWHGLLSAIPSGWALCDGQNGTPDLRSKFVKGAAAEVDPGDTGGAATHQHTYTEVPNHVHPITDPGHQHSKTASNAAGTSGSSLTRGSGTQSTQQVDSASTGITGTQNPTGGVAQGTTDAASSEPPYYALAFIMKT